MQRLGEVGCATTARLIETGNHGGDDGRNYRDPRLPAAAARPYIGLNGRAGALGPTAKRRLGSKPVAAWF